MLGQNEGKGNKGVHINSKRSVKIVFLATPVTVNFLITLIFLETALSSEIRTFNILRYFRFISILQFGLNNQWYSSDMSTANKCDFPCYNVKIMHFRNIIRHFAIDFNNSIAFAIVQINRWSSITIVTYFHDFNATFLWQCSTYFMIADCYHDFISSWEIWICREILLILFIILHKSKL